MSDLALTVEPSKLEPATSWVSRLAQRNGCFSAQEFTLDLGVSWDSIRAGDPASIKEICDIANVDPVPLMRSSYRSGETLNSKWVANEWIAPKFMRFDKIAVCASPPTGFEGEIVGEIVVYDTGFNGASVTSVDPFSLTVGDVDDMIDTGSHTVGLHDDAPAQAVVPWDADTQGSEDTEKADIMSEPVIETKPFDIAGIETEAYERVDC